MHDGTLHAPNNQNLTYLDPSEVDPFNPSITQGKNASMLSNIGGVPFESNFPSLYGTDQPGYTMQQPQQQPQQQRGRISQAATMGIIGGLGGIAQGLIGRGRRRREQREARNEYDAMRAQYENIDTSNVYADMRNQFTGMENPFEDLTVNQQQAEFQRQMFAEQQASTLQGLRSAAGGSGIAALAQAMAGQAQRATQMASASIGQQESRNQALRAKEASKIQQMERMGAAKAEQIRMMGEERARALEFQRTGTMLGMSQQRRAAADRAQAQSDAALWGGIGSLVGGFVTAGMNRNNNEQY